MDKFSSKVHRVHMELGGKLLNSLRIETQFLERLQSVSVVDGAAHLWPKPDLLNLQWYKRHRKLGQLIFSSQP